MKNINQKYCLVNALKLPTGNKLKQTELKLELKKKKKKIEII